MNRLAKLVIRPAYLAALLTIATIPPGAARADGGAPVRGTMTGTVDSIGFPTVSIAGDGQASRIGPFTVEAEHEYVSELWFTGQLTLTDGDGSRLVANYIGMSDFGAMDQGIVSDEIIAIIDRSQSTHRFARVQGGLYISSESNLVTGRFAAEITGSIWNH